MFELTMTVEDPDLQKNLDRARAQITAQIVTKVKNGRVSSLLIMQLSLAQIQKTLDISSIFDLAPKKRTHH